ncbi:MAG TPA: DUF3576 domain-containing protein [Stellaceae bacterium]|nr:DUF3576 domain-containing protein [Stellaceae bacterium]
MSLSKAVRSGALRGAGMVLLMSLSVSGCGLFGGGSSGDTKTTTTSDNPYGTDPKYADPKNFNTRTQSDQDESSYTLMSALFNSGGSGKEGGGGGGGVGVNSFLWRASLDTVSFMPLASADPFGGVIITDWYSPPKTPDERFKVNVFILGRDLRADGVRASVFHQTKDPKGQWVEASVDANTATDLENAILTRARQIRLSAAEAKQ